MWLDIDQVVKVISYILGYHVRSWLFCFALTRHYHLPRSTISNDVLCNDFVIPLSGPTVAGAVLTLIIHFSITINLHIKQG